MPNPTQPTHLLLIDIDGLRRDLFHDALHAGHLPHISQLLGGPNLENGLSIPSLSTAPSITFCAQASLFTGAHPEDHGIPGNQFFDRFGTQSNGVPRYYAFDVGETYAVDDAVGVFTNGLAGQRLQVPTFYARMNQRGASSVVAGNMYGTDATTWLKPSIIQLARLTKGGDLFGIEAEAYDQHILDQLVSHIQEEGLPDITTMYFLGLDTTSHKAGPSSQTAYLIDHIDPMIGQLWATVSQQSQSCLVALFSDHGQISVPADDHHSLRLRFPFDREIGHFFDALGLDVHDYPGEDPHCDAVLTLNGGVADVYLQNRTGRWRDVPNFNRDVLFTARAFWNAHETGKYAPELQGALAGVLSRHVERDGWTAPYQAVTPDGDVVSLHEWFGQQPSAHYEDVVNRLNNLAGPYSGDLMLLSNYPDGYYFGKEQSGIHGGLHPDDSRATLLYGWPNASGPKWAWAQEAIERAIYARCKKEANRQPSVADMLTGVEAIFTP